MSPFFELFRRAPESLSAFPFLKHLKEADKEFISTLREHGIRVYSVISSLIKQVRPILACLENTQSLKRII